MVLQLSRFLMTGIVAGFFMIFLVHPASSSDATFERAARQMREKDFSEAYALAAKSPESPRRSFLMGVASLRQGNPALAVPLLAEAEQKLPLLADYAVFFQAEAQLKLRNYHEAAAGAARMVRIFPASLLVRRAEKLHAEALAAAGDHAAALRALALFVEKYPSGADSVEALFLLGRSREETGDRAGALSVYRLIGLNNPASPQASKAQERVGILETSGMRAVPYSQEELLKTASTLYAQNEYSRAARVINEISTTGQPPAFAGRVALKSGMIQYRLRNWKQAEKDFARAVGQQAPAVRSEARFWMAKALERQAQSEQAFAVFMELVSEGRKQEFADDALMEAAGLRRGQGAYAEAIRLYGLVGAQFPESKFVSRAAWEAAWCRYLTGEYARAAEEFKLLLKDDTLREKALYWLGRSLERSGSPAAAGYFAALQDEFPAGFYATWYRDQHSLPDRRESLGLRNALAELPLPAGYDRPLLLAAVGLLDEARAELTVLRKKNGDKKNQFPGIARICLEMGDYSSAISLFLQNRPVPWEKNALPLWTAGYPAAYRELVHHHAAANGLSEAFVMALMRAESGFNPVVKSHAGAIGLMQLMPATAKMTAREKGTFNPQRLVEPGYNIRIGTQHLKELFKAYGGDVVHATAAYNAGATAVERWRKQMKGLAKDEFVENIPYQETRDYVKKVYASAATYRALYGMK